MGWFAHGSAIIVLGEAGPNIADTVVPRGTLRAGEALMHAGKANPAPFNP